MIGSISPGVKAAKRGHSTRLTNLARTLGKFSTNPSKCWDFRKNVKITVAFVRLTFDWMLPAMEFPLTDFEIDNSS